MKKFLIPATAITLILCICSSIFLGIAYGNRAKLFCMVYYPQTSREGSKVFDHYEASCYTIEKHGGGNKELDEMIYIWELEFYALEDAGLIESNNPPKLDFDALDYILKNNKKNISENRIKEILNYGFEYMEYLGIVENANDAKYEIDN
jgi:hypothetical protein